MFYIEEEEEEEETKKKTGELELHRLSFL